MKKLSVLALLALFSASNSFAVLTKKCPETLALEVTRASLMTNDEIRELPRHAKYTDTMFRDVYSSRNRLERLLNQGWGYAEFQITARASGKCIYETDDRSVANNRVVLYTTGGVDYLKHEVELFQKERAEEAFTFQSAISSYGPEGLELSTEMESEVFTTIKYTCYDRKCLADALIGTATVELR